MISYMRKIVSFRMIYVSKVDIKQNTARAKHIRSLIAASKNKYPSIKFIFYSYKKPFKNLNTLKILILNTFSKKNKIYSRDIEFVFIAAILGLQAVYEIHHFGMIRKKTRFCFINRKFLNFLSKNKNVKFVTLTKSCQRVLKYIYTNIDDSRINVIPDAGQKKKIGNLKSGSGNKNKISLNYAGSFLPGKGGLESVNLAHNLIQYQFNFAGELDKETYKSLCSAKNIKYFGYLNDNEINSFYETSDILIAPIGRRIFLDKSLKNEITFYTSPLKLYEYSFTSKPIITIDRPCTRIFRNMPGVWFIDKNKANCIRSWREIIDYVYAKRNELNELLDKRQRYLYTWNQRITAMQKIK